MVKVIPLKSLTPNKDNPRTIRDTRFRRLMESIRSFPAMLKARPIVVDENGVILGGNMRYRALKELGYTEAEVQVLSGLTDEEKRQFALKDNLSYGEWDWDEIANKWGAGELEQWDFTATTWPVPQGDTDAADAGRDARPKETPGAEDPPVAVCPQCGHSFKYERTTPGVLDLTKPYNGKEITPRG
jgi:hypothetical protein